MMASGAGLLGIKLANAAIGFATVAVFARYLPPDNYGLYLLILTWAQFLALPLQMGIPVLLTREIAIAQSQDQPGVIKGVRAWTRRIVLVGTLVIGTLVIGGYSIVVAAGWPILQDMTWPLILLCAALIPVIAEMKRVMGILNGYRKAAQSRLPDGVIRPVMLLLVGGLGVWVGWISVPGLLTVHLVSAGCAALFGWYLIGQVEAETDFTVCKAEERGAEWWASLGPLTLFAAASTVKTYSDVLMLGAMDSTEAVAFYRVAVQIASIALLIQVVVNVILSPRMAALNATGDIAQMQSMAVTGSRIAFTATMISVCFLVLLGEARFVTVFGQDYKPVYPLAVFLSFGMAANSFFGGTSTLLNMTRREKSTASYALWTAIANILLNLVLIPLLGIFGAALATIVTTLAMQVLAWSRLTKDLGFRTDAFARRR